MSETPTAIKTTTESEGAGVIVATATIASQHSSVKARALEVQPESSGTYEWEVPEGS